MIAHSQNFKKAITRTGRDLHVKIDFYTKEYALKTENNKLIITQDAKQLITEPIEQDEPVASITEDDIISLRKNNLGEIYHTYMKSFDLETYHKFIVGDKVKIQIGTTVNNNIEYLNYGTYYIYSKSYSEITRSYSYVLCDAMLFTNVDYDNNTLFGPPSSGGAYYYYEELELKEMVEDIIKRFVLEVLYPNDSSIYSSLIDTTNMVNKTLLVSRDTYKDINIAVRDVLDQVVQAGGCSLIVEDVVINDKTYPKFVCKTISDTVMDTLDEDILKDTTLTINEKFGPLNHLILSRADGLDNIERLDVDSIANNGDTTYIIKNNLILEQENRADFIDNLFNRMKGLEYITSDIDIIGVGYLEYLDRFNITAHDNLYRCICLQNTSEINNGMEEQFASPKPSEKQEVYEQNIGYDDKSASILMDKLRGTIVLKTYQDGDITKVTEVRLDSTASDGSLVNISADNINLEGYTTINGNFTIDQQGNMVCNDATINRANIVGGEITLSSPSADVPMQKITHSSTDLELAPMGVAVINNYNDEDVCYLQGSREESNLLLSAGGTSANRQIYAFSGNSSSVGKIRVRENSNSYCEYRYDGQHTQSDKRCKDNITNIEEKQSIDIITKLKPVTYNYKESKDMHRGLIAQDVKDVLKSNNIEKQIYDYDKEEDRYSLNYVELIPDLINCIKYQQKEIEQLKKEIKELKNNGRN